MYIVVPFDCVACCRTSDRYLLLSAMSKSSTPISSLYFFTFRFGTKITWPGMIGVGGTMQ